MSQTTAGWAAGSFEGSRLAQLADEMAATPEQRLEVLEKMIELVAGLQRGVADTAAESREPSVRECLPQRAAASASMPGVVPEVAEAMATETMEPRSSSKGAK